MRGECWDARFCARDVCWVARVSIRDECSSWTFLHTWWMLELDVLVYVMNAERWILCVHILQTNCWRFRHGQCQVSRRVTLLRMIVWIRPHVANGVHQNLCSAFFLCPTNIINWSNWLFMCDLFLKCLRIQWSLFAFCICNCLNVQISQSLSLSLWRANLSLSLTHTHSHTHTQTHTHTHTHTHSLSLSLSSSFLLCVFL